MTNEESRPAEGNQRRTANDHVGAGQTERTRSNWPEHLNTQQLVTLVRRLDHAVKAAIYDLPGASAEVDDLLYATAIARTTLRRRRAREQVDKGRQALRDAGWRG
jgi:hypothetical protein